MSPCAAPASLRSRSLTCRPGLIDAVEDRPFGEESRLGVAEIGGDFRHREQVDFPKYVVMAGQNVRIRRPVKVFRNRLLGGIGVEILQIGLGGLPRALAIDV